MARAARDPLAAIVAFFLTQPLAICQSALTTASTILKTRAASEKPQAGQIVVRQRPRTRAPQQPAAAKTGTRAGLQEIAPAVRTGESPGATEATKAPATPPHDPTQRTAGGTPRRRRTATPAATKTTGATPPMGTGTTAPAGAAVSSRPPVEDVPPAGEFPPQ